MTNFTPKQPSAVYGYARVSSLSQNEDRQLISLQQAGVLESHIFIDHKSGKDFNRPAWKKLVRHLHRGDLLVVTSLDRFGRNYDEIQTVWRKLTKQKKVDIRILDIPLLDTTLTKGFTEGFITDLFLQILAYVSHMEREHIHTRQKEGIAAARLRGVKFGRPRVQVPNNFTELIQQVHRKELSTNDAARICGFSTATLKRRMKGLLTQTSI